MPDYKAAGAQIISSADQVWPMQTCSSKVKGPSRPVRSDAPGQTLFTLPPIWPPRDHAVSDASWPQGPSIAYLGPFKRQRPGALPLLAPMSEVAGRLARTGRCIPPDARTRRSRVLMGRTWRRITDVVVIGGGNGQATNTAAVAKGMGARVTCSTLKHQHTAQDRRRIRRQYRDPRIRRCSELSKLPSVKANRPRHRCRARAGAKALKLVTNKIPR